MGMSMLRKWLLAIFSVLIILGIIATLIFYSCISSNSSLFERKGADVDSTGGTFSTNIAAGIQQYQLNSGKDLSSTLTTGYRSISSSKRPRAQKIAYVFAGSARSFVCPKVHWSIKVNLIDSLGGSPHTFVRISLEDNVNTKTGTGRLTLRPYRKNEIEQTLKILNPRDVQYFSYKDQVFSMQTQFPGLLHSIVRENDQRRYSMFFHRSMAYRMVLKYELAHQMEFDWVVLVRLDAAWLEPVLPIEAYAKDRVWITETGYDRFNDQFMLIPRQFSDYIYDLDSKIQNGVYCLGGPDVELWKCNATELALRQQVKAQKGKWKGPREQNFLQPGSATHIDTEKPHWFNEFVINATLELCCSDLLAGTGNRIGNSEAIHARHLERAGIPVSLARFPVFLTRRLSDNPCYSECFRIYSLSYKEYAFRADRIMYPALKSPQWPDTRSTGISARDKAVCYHLSSRQHYWNPISAYKWHKLQVHSNSRKAPVLAALNSKSMNSVPSYLFSTILRGRGSNRDVNNNGNEDDDFQQTGSGRGIYAGVLKHGDPTLVEAALRASNIADQYAFSLKSQYRLPEQYSNSLDYSKRLVDQRHRVHPSILVHPKDTEVWRIHPTFNMEGCLTFNYATSKAEWQTCRDHMDRHSLRYDPRQLFFLYVIPPLPSVAASAGSVTVSTGLAYVHQHQRRQLGRKQATGSTLFPGYSLDLLASFRGYAARSDFPSSTYRDDIPETTRIVIWNGDSKDLDFIPMMFCLTVDRPVIGSRVGFFQCSANLKNPKQLFRTVRAQMDGSHRQSVVGQLQLAADSQLCVARADVDDESIREYGVDKPQSSLMVTASTRSTSSFMSGERVGDVITNKSAFLDSDDGAYTRGGPDITSDTVPGTSTAKSISLVSGILDNLLESDHHHERGDKDKWKKWGALARNMLFVAPCLQSGGPQDPKQQQHLVHFEFELITS